MHKFKIITKSGDFDISDLTTAVFEAIGGSKDKNSNTRLNPTHIIGAINCPDNTKGLKAFTVILADGRKYKVFADNHCISASHFEESNYVVLRNDKQEINYEFLNSFKLIDNSAIFLTEHVAAVVEFTKFIEETDLDVKEHSPSEK